MFKSKGLIIFSLCFVVSTAYAKTPQTYMSLPNPGLPLINQAQLIKPLKNDIQLHFVVSLNLRNKKQFDQLVADIYHPKSVRYQKFLTNQEFNQQYAPSPEVENKVLHYFISEGMQAKIIHHSVRVTATVAQIEKTFQVKMNYYRYQDKTIYANASAPLLRTDIAQYVTDISGLNTFPRFHPNLRARPVSVTQDQAVKPQNINLAWNSFKPLAQPTTTSFAGFTGANLQTTYKLANIAPIAGTNIDGAGQTIVIIDACGTNSPERIMADANLYNTANGITPFTAANFTVIHPDGTPLTRCDIPNAKWDGEIALDIAATHTFAPGAKIALVLARSDFELDHAVREVTDTLTNNNFAIGGFTNAYVVSNSWGEFETDGSSPGTETKLQTAAGYGISFNFSTGDCGDGTYESTWTCHAHTSPTVQYPASSAFATAVGGSSLFVDNSWNYAFETVWGSYYDDGFYGGTTGGISVFYGPVAWQSSISTFTAGGYTLGTVGFYNKRALPDIAMIADPYTGLTIYEGGRSFVYGGTSLACPSFSGTLTLLNQARALLNGGVPHPIGQAAPYLYTNNSTLLYGQALNLITPPHQVISGALPPPRDAPLSAFRIFDPYYNYHLTFGWDSSLTIAPENQFWNDGVGVGSPNLPNFIAIMAQL